jgi:chemotaxis protein methyltransferase CheR
VANIVDLTLTAEARRSLHRVLDQRGIGFFLKRRRREPARLDSLRIAWEELPGKKPRLRLLATDIDPVSLERAAAGSYPESSLREVPDGLRRKYFEREGESYRVREEVRRSVSFRKMDLLRDGSPGRFGLILCRNAAFTYFGPDQRVSVAAMLGKSLEEGGYLVLGRTESLPKEAANLFEPAFPAERIYRLRAGSQANPG